MPERYFQASRSYLSWGDEGTPYEKAATSNQIFGITSQDVAFPNPNPHGVLPTGGHRRGPVVHHALEREYAIPVGYDLLDENAPLHAALGSLTATARDPDSTPATGDEYTEYLFEEADKLPTITIEHGQEDADLLEWFVGAKSNLGISIAKGQPVRVTQDFMAPIAEPYDDTTPTFAALAYDETLQPFKFTDMLPTAVTLAADGSPVDTLETVDGMDLGWDNGLEVQHHGNGRDGYSVTENVSAAKYDAKLSLTLKDLTMWKRVRDDGDLVNLETQFVRETGTGGVAIDAFIVRLLDCKVIDLPMPRPAEGRITGDLVVSPLNTELEIRRPA
jgi:hypothetical protein